MVEHMWLRSTTERSNGLPFIPNEFNTGPEGSGEVWEIIAGETEATFDPGMINQNTYFVRCTRSISCCEFVETNLVGFRIDNSAQCPIAEEAVFERIDNCIGAIVLDSRDDMRAGDQKEYRTNQTIRATNSVGAGASTIYNAQSGVTLDPGFEVQLNGELQVKTEGCNN